MCSDRACRSTSLHIARFASALRAPRCTRRIPVLCRGTLRAEAPPFERPRPLYPRGPRSRPGCAVPLHPHLRPHPPHSQAHPDFTAPRLIRNAFAVHPAPRRPPSGSTLSLSFLPDPPHAGPTFRSFTGSLLLRPVRLLAPLCRFDQNSSGHRDFSRVGGGALSRWPPSAAQTARTHFV